jgi:hypothetical protein
MRFLFALPMSLIFLIALVVYALVGIALYLSGLPFLMLELMRSCHEKLSQA